MEHKRSSRAICFIALFSAGFAYAQSRVPSATSAIPPASMVEATIPSGGSRINGFVYLSAGEGPHPIVILLHGYPGNERNLDLGQAIRRAGYDALYFDYRGSWGSGGTFSFEHGLEDVDAVLAWVRDPANIAKYHFDAHRIALVGHSTGAWFALMTATHEPPEVCVAAIAAENVGWEGEDFTKNTDARTEALNYFRSTTADGGPIRADPDELLDQMVNHAVAWDYLALAEKIKSHRLLLVSAIRDTPEEGVAMHGKLVDAIHRADGKLVRSLVFDDDHAFSSRRLALANALTRWLKSECVTGQRVQQP